MNFQVNFASNFAATVVLPTSKSIANRELLINAQCTMHNAQWQPSGQSQLVSDDILVMRRGLAATDGDTIDVDGAGTALRFLTAYWATREGCNVAITGNARLCERPIAPLIEALRLLGADIVYTAQEGHAPLRITGRQLQGRRLAMRGDVSSQFVSALLMIAPGIGGLELELTGEIVSRPYIDMTLALMQRHGVRVGESNGTFTVPAGAYLPAPASDEGDWSAAAFWLALQALLPDARITLGGLRPDSVQGDRRILTFMEQMGMVAHWHDDGSLTMDMSRAQCCCCSTFADLTGTPDLAPILVVLLCLLGRPFRLTGLRTLRDKESNRMEALRAELRKVGYRLTLEGDDAVSWHFATCPPQEHPVIDPHGDHRIAMAMALAAVCHPGLAIDNPQVVNKSYPHFWEQLRIEN